MNKKRLSLLLAAFCAAGPLLAESAPSSPSLQPSRAVPSSSVQPPPMAAGGSDLVAREPLYLESLAITSRHRLDWGLGFGFDMFHPDGVSSSDFNTLYVKMAGQLGYRFAPNKKLEFGVSAPLLLQMFIYGGTAGVDAEDDSAAGLGQVKLGAKYAFHPNLGVHAFTELATGDTDSTPASGEGMNYGATLIGEFVRGGSGLHAGLGQIVKSEYTRTPEGGTAFDRDPGDVTVFSLAFTSMARARRVQNRFGGAKTVQPGLVLELNNYTVGDEKLGGATVADTGGTATNVSIGLVVGSQSQASNGLFKFGLTFGAGSEDLQSFDVERGAGDVAYFLNYSSRWGEVR